MTSVDKRQYNDIMTSVDKRQKRNSVLTINHENFHRENFEAGVDVSREFFFFSSYVAGSRMTPAHGTLTRGSGTSTSHRRWGQAGQRRGRGQAPCKREEQIKSTCNHVLINMFSLYLLYI